MKQHFTDAIRAGAILAAALWGTDAFAQAAAKWRVEPVPPPRWKVSAAEWRLAASNTIPATESAQQAIFSETVSGIPDAGASIDRITAPPWTGVLQQRVAVRDLSSGDSQAAPEFTWEPGAGIAAATADGFRWTVTTVALNRPQGFVLRVEVSNTSRVSRRFRISSAQEPRLARPPRWGYGTAFRNCEPAPVVETAGGVAVHEAPVGAVAFGIAGPGATAERDGQGSRATTEIAIEPGRSASVYAAFAMAGSGSAAGDAVRGVLAQPAAAMAQARGETDAALQELAKRLPAFAHPDARLVRFYRHAALQLLYDRWRVGKTFVLDPWYPTGGRDSGALDAYAWDLGYSALTLSILDPQALRGLLIALLRAPLTEHYSIDPVTGTGNGPFYAYNPYAYTWAVDRYLRATGDFTLLREQSNGKTVLEWLVTLAAWGEAGRDPDGNGLLDFGNDRNLLELKKTGTGPGYVHEVPSPNGERVYVYETVARWLDGGGQAATAREFRERAQRVREALNRVLWLEREGWYGTRQADGSIVPVYSIQIFDLLRFPGLVPEDRARRLLAHLNGEEFLGPWGVRSLSKRDRLFDYSDHDWAGPMSYIGDAPQLVADILGRGFVKEARAALERILWWPEHLAVLPQGIANDDYTFRYPAAARFGGRISGGRTNMISGVVGVETVIRGLFGVERQTDGAIRFSARRLPGEGPSSLEFPFRGATWLVTQRDEGLFAGIAGGIEASLFRQDGSLEFLATPSAVRIRASVREPGPARLAVPLEPLLRHFHVATPARLSIRWDGQDASRSIHSSRIVLSIRRLTAAGSELLVEAGR